MQYKKAKINNFEEKTLDKNSETINQMN